MENKKDELTILKSNLLIYWILLAIMVIDLVAIVVCLPNSQKLAILMVCFILIYVVVAIIATVIAAPSVMKFYEFTGLSNSDGMGCIMIPLYFIAMPIMGIVVAVIGPFALIYKIIKTHEKLESLKSN